MELEMKKRYLSGSLLMLCTLSGYSDVQIADSDATSEKTDETELMLDAVLITGGEEVIQTLPGSAQLLDEVDLEKFDYTDINQVVSQMPGIYIREEDGYGLRPNIGIRGATTERSQKITIMEDGILIAPAPYSAPAAYYLPNINRMQAVELFKGPASIQYGPHTVGGALNLVTQQIPEGETGEFDLSLGSDGYKKARALYGNSSDQFGYLIEALHYGSDGFKELERGDTGFERNDVNLKLRFSSAPGASVAQQFDIKLGYAEESSDETYLGLTDEDFNNDPYQRYAASQLDHFDSEHTQVHLVYTADFNNGFTLTSKTYFNQFDRAWNKFDGLMVGIDTRTVLANPDIFPNEIDVIRGRRNSSGDDSQVINVTDFAREYGSYGSEISGTYELNRGAWFHKVTAGLRYHHDYVERDHQIEGYNMVDGRLIDDGESYGKKDLNEDSTDAIAMFVQDAIEFNDWQINAGLRVENIEGETTDKLSESSSSRSTTVVIPGIGAFYQYTEELGFLAGINKGFSPNGPQAGDDVEPEESTNLEFGLRYSNEDLYLEAIGFYSDYSNLIARCRTSDATCNAGDEFNGGDVEIIGLELQAQQRYDVSSYSIPVSLAYTYTESEFQDSFDSTFSQWGQVEAGDELPYLPNHLARLQVGLEATNWDASLAAKYRGEMREVAGQGDNIEGSFVEDLLTWDLAGNYYFGASWSFQMKVENLTDEVEIASRRPFGARPNSPRTVIGTVRYRF